MKSQRGFSLAEMMAALFVLALAAIAVSEIISGLMRGWGQVSRSIDRSDQLQSIIEEIDSIQSKSVHRDSTLAITYSDGTELIVARSRVERDSSCSFDMVARQCR